MPLFEVAIIKKKTETEPEKLMDPGVFPKMAKDAAQAKAMAMLDDSQICSTNLDDYEVLVRPFV